MRKKRIRKPDFFIVGAPKCGTSALYEYLRHHPRIFMPFIKEPHFFAEDFSSYRAVDSLLDYVRLFEKRRSRHLAAGEASPLYLYSSVAMTRIRTFNGEAKIIVMLRNPIDLLQSFHSQLVRSLDEDEGNLERAWRLQPLRRKGLHFPKLCREAALLRYSEVVKLGAQVRRLLSIFPREQVRLIMFEDFQRDTRLAYEGTLSFLGVPSDGRLDFPRVNPNAKHRIRWLGRLMLRPPKPLAFLALISKRLAGVDSFGVWGRLGRLNKAETDRQAVSLEFRRELIAELREDVAELSETTQRDLIHWLR